MVRDCRNQCCAGQDNEEVWRAVHEALAGKFGACALWESQSPATQTSVAQLRALARRPYDRHTIVLDLTKSVGFKLGTDGEFVQEVQAHEASGPSAGGLA